MEQPNLPEQPIDFKWSRDAKIILSPQEFELLTRPVRMFEMAIAIANNKVDEAISTKQYLPVYKADCKTDEKGNILADNFGKAALKDEKAFFAKYQQKEEKKPTIVVDSMGNTN